MPSRLARYCPLVELVGRGLKSLSAYASSIHAGHLPVRNPVREDGSIPVWSTKYSIHRKWLKVRGLGGSIARNVGFDNVLISNDILLETRLKSNRTHQTASMS